MNEQYIVKDRFSPDIEITYKDFESSGWEKAFQGNGMNVSSCVSETLAKMGQKAGEDGQTAQSKVLWLLADVCSMMLNPSSFNEPFKPYFRSRTNRSAITDDFTEKDIDYFHLILPAATHPWLKARLSDLIWLRQRSKTDLALSAIDSYLMIPISLESFEGDGGSCWIRAIQLTRILKHVTGKRIKDIQNRILESIRHATEKDGFLARWLSDLLKGFGLGTSFENEIAEKLVSLADVFKAQSDFHRAREYYEPSIYWFDKAGKEHESFKSIVCQAEVWNAEEEMHELSGNFHGAAHCLEKAIQLYRSIPNKHRSALGIENKLQQLQLKLTKTGQRAAEDMTLVSIPLPDITDMVAESRILIQGKTSSEALKILANLYPGAKKAKLRISAEQALAQFHLGSFFGLAVRSHDGGCN
jgi:tetratricopeptide (TPR) repeat protein